MSFDKWWEEKSGWGGEKLAEYNLAKAAYEFGKREAYGDFEEEKRASHTEAMWEERQGEEYGSY